MKNFPNPSVNLSSAHCRASIVVLLGISILALTSGQARANVYATNLRLNGAITNAPLAQGGSVLISYTLNEPATLGVAVDIKQGGTTVRSITLTNGGPGTAVGSNSVSWDGTDGTGHMLPGGSYAVSITASASGYTNWAQISSDANTNNQCWAPRGVAVNVNMNSAYYGRIFMANSGTGPNPTNFPGDRIGILKLNADGSAAAEGIFATGGYNWSHGQDQSDYLSPEKIEIGTDDRVYINDAFNAQPTILSFDQTISTNSMLTVLTPANLPNGEVYDGPFISGSGTNMQIWMADEGFFSLGIVRWNLGADGKVATNDLGTVVVEAGLDSALDQYPVDMAVDRSNRIYTLQLAAGAGAPVNRVMRFPAYTNVALTNADWIFATNGDRYTGGFGIAVNPAGTLVAAAFYGLGGFDGNGINGSAAVFDANTNVLVANLAPTNTPGHQFMDVAWDNAGNLYAVDQGDPHSPIEGILRIYSPSGTNQATTVAIPVIQLAQSQPMPPVLSEPVYEGGFVRFTLYGEPNVTYIILASTNLFNWFPVATNTSALANREIVLPAPPGQTYYRAVVSQSQPTSPSPVLSAIGVTGGQFQFSLSGQANLSYIILGSSDLKTWNPVLTNTSPNAIRTVSVPANGNTGSFRAKVGP